MIDAGPDITQRAAGMLAIAERRVLQTYPFHARFIARWQRRATTLVPTMGVTVRDGNILLFYNPGFVTQCTFDELAGVLHHEVNHLLLGHVFLDPDQFADQQALTIAEEVTANEFIHEPLPLTPILLADYPDLPPREDTLTRYKRLEGDPNCQPMDQNSTHPVPNSADSGPDPDTVDTLDDHTVWIDAREAGPVGELVVRVSIARAAAALSPEERQGLPDALRQQIARMSAGMAVGVGEEALTPRPGRVDWRMLLRHYVRAATERRPVFNRPPRRFPDLVGILPGTSRRPERATVMAVIDTSASMTTPLLDAIAGELTRLARSHEVTIVECDAAVQRVYPYTGELTRVYGRGGTDLRPPFAAELLRRVNPDVVVVCTDGFGPTPSAVPAIPVIWCLTPDGVMPAPWGRKVQLPWR
jgi:predicted metal-dependent peptidase